MYHAGSFVQVSTPSGVHHRAGPDSGTTSQATIPNGAAVFVVGDSQNGWANVLWNGKPGWVFEQYVRPIEAKSVPVGTWTTTGSGVNLRTDPGLGSNVLGLTGPVGDSVESAGVLVNDFVAVAYKGQSGYMSAAYIKPPGAVAPLVAPPVDVATRQPPQLPPSGGGQQPVPTTPAAITTKPAAGGAVIAGGLLALALVIYFVAK